MTTIVSALPPVSPQQREQIAQSPRTTAEHAIWLNALPAMEAVEVGGAPHRAHLPRGPIGVAAWNVERCLFPEDTAEHLRPHGVDVVLLSEVDNGMARTAQQHTTARMADALGMAYAYGVEFFEMGLGGPTERVLCQDNFNQLGWHGNAILSSVPFDAVALFRLDSSGHWFASGEGSAADPAQPRVGGRMAIAAVLPSEFGPVCVVSTHLESNADAAHRHAQFAALLDHIDGFAPGMPVLIGGDLNTGNHMPPVFDWREETLFSLAESRDYSWTLNAEGMTTRPSLITPHPDRAMKLDWFAARGFDGRARAILSSVDGNGRPLSDHDCVLCDIHVNGAEE